VHYFVDLQGETHFCVRTWWDRRILVNLVRLKQVSDGHFAETLDQKERTIVLKTLQEAVPKYVGTEKADDARDTYAVVMDMSAVRSAAYLAGRLKIREAIKFLKPLESVASAGTIADFWHSREDASKDIELTYFTYPLRRVIQVSLRQLGETPHNYPATKLEFSIEHNTRFFSYGPKQDYAARHELASQLKDNKAFTYQAKEYKKSRHERTSQLSEGMRAVAVLDAMGPPDVVDTYEDEWRWDVCAQKPYSVVVKWDQQSRTVTSVRQIGPLWLRKELIHEERRQYR
jgi:hypothetical protein